MPRPRTWKQLLLKLGVFILIGAIVNIAVAWFVPYAFGERQIVASFGAETVHRWYPLGGANRGWPLPALESDRYSDDAWQSHLSFQLGGSFKLWQAVKQSVNEPLRPMWPGFAINTIFYAALLWVLWVSPGKIRRLARIRRGCCPACGYKIAPGGGIGPRCSECGHELCKVES